MKTWMLTQLRQLRCFLETACGKVLSVFRASCTKKIVSLHGAGERVTNDKFQWKIIWPASTQNRPPPLHLNQLPVDVQALFAKEKAYPMPQGGIARGAGIVDGETAAVLLADGVLLKEPSRQIAHNILQHPVIRKRRFRTEHTTERIFFANFDQGSTFYHWLYDVLPLLLIPEFRQHLQTEITVVCPPIKYAYQRESLALAGLAGLSLLPVDSFKCVEADDVIVPVLPQTTGHQHEVVIDALRRAFLPNEGRQSHRGKRRVFISRRKALRGLANEDEVLDVLSRFAVESILLEEMSFAEQVRLFAESELVVAPHGAGLSHLAFMPLKSKVVELFSSDFINPCYWRLATVCDLHYVTLMGEPAKLTFRPEHDSYSVYPELVEKTVEGALSKV
jgi:capsular polysaccharide biosynthesis protein